MRTTLTLDPDVAQEIERLRRSRSARQKDIVNEALRRGLRDLEANPGPRKPFRTKPIKGAVLLLPNVDNIAEVIAFAEGEDHK